MTGSECTKDHVPVGNREIVSGLWLSHDEAVGEFVEVVLPPGEMDEILGQCRKEFPEFLTRAGVVTAESGNGRDEREDLRRLRLLARGLSNIQVICVTLEHRHLDAADLARVLPVVQQAFRLALQGRFKLTLQSFQAQ